MNLAIVIGVENYISDEYENLPACKNDANTIKDVIEDVKDIEKVLFFNNSELAKDVKRKINAFVKKYQEKDINELFFYFTGHGKRCIQEKDRDINDFLYILHDFDSKKQRSTSLSNSDLDNWAKTLSPKLFVKIVDACFSGTQYIKGETDEKLNFEKSAKKYSLNDIHFWFSSRENQKSLADENLSKFTESILLAITEFEGETRYREIKDFIADDFDGKKIAKPYFIDQSNNTEKFGIITKNTHEIVNKVLYGELNNKNLTSKEIEEKKSSIFDLAIQKSDKLCFSEKTLVQFMKDFNKNISSWDSDFENIYEIKITIDDSVYIPNRSQIREWLAKNKSYNYFAEPNYKEKKYEVQEYIELLPKPKRGINSAFVKLLNNSYNTEYKLETVIKRREYIDGFLYTHSIKNIITHISFIPKIEIADAISLYIIPIYSNTNMVMHIAYEILKRNNWKNFSFPTCQNWKLIQIDINSDESAKNTSKKIQNELKKWLEDILSNKLN